MCIGGGVHTGGGKGTGTHTGERLDVIGVSLHRTGDRDALTHREGRA